MADGPAGPVPPEKTPANILQAAAGETAEVRPPFHDNLNQTSRKLNAVRTKPDSAGETRLEQPGPPVALHTPVVPGQVPGIP